MSDIKLAPIRHSGTKEPLQLGIAEAREALCFHRTLPGYAPTPLIELKSFAARLGINRFFVKDESPRFGLNAFKGLGGSFAMHAVADGRKNLRFITATDGNHGRGVAWAARSMGHRAIVYMPAGSASERLENIRKLGAEAEITELCYDDTVRLAAKTAEENGCILLQDTAWEGYETVPALIMQGYTTMGAEIKEQLSGTVPTHIFLQAGVGAFAGAMTSYFADAYTEHKPTVVIVEPEGADCLYRTASADDSILHFCGSDIHTVMAGLCCGEPCSIAWDILQKHADFVVTCPDAVAEDGMRLYAHPLGEDPRIVSGESGAVTGGLIAALMEKPENAGLRDLLGLGADSVVLCISTEGDTDKENYKRITETNAAAPDGAVL